MHQVGMRIGVVAPGSRIEPELADRVRKLAAALYPDRIPTIYFHPQCFQASGHFAGDDSIRGEAFCEIANDERFDALWFARGGYGACRLLERFLPFLAATARSKTYLGYSDNGYILAGLYGLGFAGLAHGPMPSDLNRAGGEAAVTRALQFLVDRAPDAFEPSLTSDNRAVAFNMTILSQLLGTPYQPDLADHVLMLEEVAEHMYRIDRCMFHMTSNPEIRKVAGIMLGRCSEIPDNDPDFGQTEEDVVQHWCKVSGIRYLGRADIGHDIGNRVVPFGSFAVS